MKREQLELHKVYRIKIASGWTTGNLEEIEKIMPLGNWKRKTTWRYHFTDMRTQKRVAIKSMARIGACVEGKG